MTSETFELAITLEHRVALDGGDPYAQIVQHYQTRILHTCDDVETLAGTFDFYVANVDLAINSGLDIVDVADSIDQDVFEYCSALFESGTTSEIREEVLDQFGFPEGDRVLMLHLAKVLALVAAHRIIQQFGGGLAVLKPQPLQHHDGFNRDPQMAFESLESEPAAALDRLTSHWQRLGFELIENTGLLGLSTRRKLPEPKLRPAAQLRIESEHS